MFEYDVIVIGAGASGLMCAIEAGKRGRKVLVLDHANKAGKKILMSGGGRCNFTNYTVEPENFLSFNPHFCKSALSRYTQWDFLALIDKYKIAFHEREYGRLFCDESSKEIVRLLLSEAKLAKVEIQLNSTIEVISNPNAQQFIVKTSQGIFKSESLVIATGGLSIPKIGATPFGYKIAEQFGINVLATRAGLVPFTLQPEDKAKFSPLSGIAVLCIASNDKASFKENILFTHRGLSGPAVLQLSSYWQAGEAITINLLPEIDLSELLTQKRQQKAHVKVKTFLAEYLPKRLLTTLLSDNLLETTVVDLSDKKITALSQQLQQWQIKPNGTEGYRTAEVTLGGVDCDEVSSKTMQSNQVAGLYFIGEVLDITGWLGGYNFQWAWSSGWCAGQYV
ncbi:MAG: aminoacetone oxidase family FAD-binding enzyme [Methylococcaceae bacterium]|nr:aminoacetone oxidase family FAD-binding enzyme [Methylococcaceae bacterium]